MNLIFGIIGFIGICVCISRKSVVGGLIISCICCSVLTFLNSDPYINLVERSVDGLIKTDTVIVYDTIYQHIEEPIEIEEEIDCGCDDEVIESDTTVVDTVETDTTESDTIIIYPNRAITQEELNEFVDTVELVIDSLEESENRIEKI